MTPLIRNLCIHRSCIACVPAILHQCEMTAPVDMGLGFRTECEAVTLYRSKPIGWKVMLFQAKPSVSTDVVITLLGQEEIIIGTTKRRKLPGAFENFPAVFDMPCGVVQDSRVQHGLRFWSNCPRHLACWLRLALKSKEIT